MSCHLNLRRTIADLIGDSETVELYRALADEGRREDFRWLALSQGVPAERLDELWRFVRKSARAPLSA